MCAEVGNAALEGMITAAITQVAANKLKIKTDAKCDLGSSHCYPAFFSNSATYLTTPSESILKTTPSSQIPMYPLWKNESG